MRTRACMHSWGAESRRTCVRGAASLHCAACRAWVWRRSSRPGTRAYEAALDFCCAKAEVKLPAAAADDSDASESSAGGGCGALGATRRPRRRRDAAERPARAAAQRRGSAAVVHSAHLATRCARPDTTPRLVQGVIWTRLAQCAALPVGVGHSLAVRGGTSVTPRRRRCARAQAAAHWACQCRAAPKPRRSSSEGA